MAAGGARDPEVALAMRSRSRQAQDWLAKGFAAWIADGLVEPTAPPDVLASVFRALVIGFETQHRIDPDNLSTDEVATAFALVTGADTAVGTTPTTGTAPARRT